MPCRRANDLFQLIGNFIDAGLRADVILAGRTGDTDRANDFTACLDRQSAGQRQHVYWREPTVSGLSVNRLTKSAEGWLNVRAV